MCPFSHDIESTTRPAPCKYFAKGGCKFGRKCALLHISPDGTIMNRMPQGFQQQQYMTSPQMPAGFAPPPPGLLSMQAQGLEPRPNGDGTPDYDGYPYGGKGNEVPPFDVTYTSASPKYGSPAGQSDRFATSPQHKGLSVLDAPLPSSFDSSGISMAAMNGPHPASVPSRFGLESPPSSFPRKSQFGNTTLRDLHSSAFGDRGMDGVLAGIGSSPPSGVDEPLTFPKRSLHSERLRGSRPIFSASLGTRLPTQSFEYSDDDEEGDSGVEEDLLPASLRDLIPEGKLRRGSRNTFDDETPAAFLAAQRRTISINNTPRESRIEMAHSSSPSRYSSVFASTSGQAGKSEVGSPLRNSGFPLAPPSKPSNGDISPSISSPPRQASMSMLTQELQRTKLDAARSQAGQPSAPIRTASKGHTTRKSLDRGVSANSVGKIDEEQELFDMDEISGPIRPAARTNASDLSTSGGAWSTKPFGSSPGNAESAFGAIGGHRSSK